MRNKQERLRIRNMALDFANSRHSIGNESIQFWLFEMESFYNRDDKPMDNYTSDQSFYSLARNYFINRNSDYWPEDVKWTVVDGFYKIKSFRLEYIFKRRIKKSFSYLYLTL